MTWSYATSVGGGEQSAATSNVNLSPMPDQRTDPPVDTPTSATLGIICGAGMVPLAVADAVTRRGRPVVLFALRGWADATAVKAYPHHWIALGQFGRICRIARQEGCREMVFVGGLVRPSIWRLRLDWGTLMQMPLIVRSFRGGDDHLLSGVGRLFEKGGFRVVGAHEVAPEITAPVGSLGRFGPNAAVEDDIGHGFALLADRGRMRPLLSRLFSCL